MVSTPQPSLGVSSFLPLPPHARPSSACSVAEFSLVAASFVERSALLECAAIACSGALSLFSEIPSPACVLPSLVRSPLALSIRCLVPASSPLLLSWCCANLLRDYFAPRCFDTTHPPSPPLQRPSSAAFPPSLTCFGFVAVFSAQSCAAVGLCGGGKCVLGHVCNCAVFLTLSPSFVFICLLNSSLCSNSTVLLFCVLTGLFTYAVVILVWVSTLSELTVHWRFSH